MELIPLDDHDVPLVEIWLNKEHVKRWYEIPRLGITIDDWMLEIYERNRKFKWLTYLIALWQGQPIGLCQYYKSVDSDENFGSLPLEGSFGIDYLIGDETYLGKGLGKRMVRSLVDKIFSFPDAQRVTANIDKDNRVSQKTLLSCGFSLVDAERCRYFIQKLQNH